MTDAVIARIEQQLADHPILLYMKGSPDSPMCGFSNQAVQILKQCEVAFGTVDILDDEDVRQALKSYSDWPTYPQLYIRGELIGGCDIMMQLFERGELRQQLQAATA